MVERLTKEGTTAVTTEIAHIHRTSISAQWTNLQFNHFPVNDDEPLLFHTGLRGMHAEIREAEDGPFADGPGRYRHVCCQAQLHCALSERRNQRLGGDNACD
jgi:hypothetical protein